MTKDGTVGCRDPAPAWESVEKLYSPHEVRSRERIYQQCRLQYGAGVRCTRLIGLLPGTFPEPLACRLFAQDLDAAAVPAYTALSYVWGDPTVLQPVYVNGSILGITYNLHAALMHLRDPAESRNVWIDAVCIDQGSIEERNYQIGQMRRIYGGADEVVAWLGEAADDSDDAVSYIGSAAWKGSGGGGDGPTAALEKLFARPYWTRVWVVQELTVARTRASFRCGYKTMPLVTLAEYLANQRLSVVESDASTHTVATYLLRLTMRDDDDDVYGFLMDSAQLEATRPVDKIYGLLGLFPPRFRATLQPDYRKPFGSLMIDVVRACAAFYGRLDILVYFMPHYRAGCSDGPTWIPSVAKRAVGLREHYNTPGARHTPEFHISETTLEVRGFVVSRITGVQGPFATSREKLAAADTGASLRRMHTTARESLARMYPGRSRRDLENKFFAMAAGDRIYGHYSQARPVPCHALWLAMVAAGRRGLSEDAARQFEFTFMRLDQRCFFTTASGHIGVGADDIAAGDLVCVLYGCRLPVVLRAVPGASEGVGRRYTFHCPAYLDGIMGGEPGLEIASDPGCGVANEVTFCIV